MVFNDPVVKASSPSVKSPGSSRPKVPASPGSWNHVTILTFNYDRSLEYYLSTAVGRRTKRGRDDSTARVAGADEVVIAGGPTVIHLHGQLLGPYSSTWSKERLDADGLFLLSSADSGSAEFERAREAIGACQSLYFLGFGFHAKSVGRLGDFTDPTLAGGITISGTHGGFTPPEWDRTRSLLFPHGWDDRHGWGSVMEFLRYNEI